nr:MAG TPA: hypothetical protein [Caudoviricetes sp.]
MKSGSPIILNSRRHSYYIVFLLFEDDKEQAITINQM